MVKFESYKISQGTQGSNNIKTPKLTIKSIRKLRDDEHKMTDYDFNAPYEAKVEEEVIYENNIVSHSI